MLKNNLLRAKPAERVLYSVILIVFLVSWLMPVLSSMASAAQITSRSLSLSTAQPSKTGVVYSYAFSLPSSANVQSMQFQSCTTAVGSCVAPTTQNINQGTQQGTNGFTSTTTFTRDAVGAGGCTAANNVLCVKRTQATSETGAKTLAWNTQTNPSTVNTAFYVRMTTYSDVAWASAVDTGTVAAAIVQTLTVSANVAEILNFCVGSTTVIDATSDPTPSGAHDCTVISGTSVNIGTLDPSTVNISPVSTNGGNNTNGIAMLRTNAQNGATVSYDAVQPLTGTNHIGTLRISGSTCSAATGPGTNAPAASGPFTDSCVDAAGGTQNAFVAGSEEFGMTIAGVNCGSTTSYTCVYASGSNSLQQVANYIGGTNATTYGASAAKGFAWDETGAAVNIATSASSSIKQVDDEALILVFAGTPTITTPFGTYTVQADFIAVPGY